MGGRKTPSKGVGPENTPLSSQMLLVLISYIFCVSFFFFFSELFIQTEFSRYVIIVIYTEEKLYCSLISNFIKMRFPLWYIMHHPWVPLLFIADKCEQDTQLISTHPYHVWWCCPRAPGPGSFLLSSWGVTPLQRTRAQSFISLNTSVFTTDCFLYGLPWWLSRKESACNAGDAG